MPEPIRFDRQTSRIVQFLEVARTGNIHAAARALNLTQSALTKSIQTLERQLGVTLFERTQVGTTLTPQGQALLRHARAIEAELRAAEQALEDLRLGRAGLLRVAAGPVWLGDILPRVAAKLRDGPGDALLSCLQLRPPDPVMGLIDNEFDVLCSIMDPRLQADPAFAVKPKARFGMCLVMAAGHPLAALPAAKALPRLAGFPFVLFEQNWTMNRKLTDHLAQLGLPPPRVALRTDSVLPTLNMIRATDSIGFLAAPIARFVDMAGLVAHPLDAPVFRMEVGLMHRRAIEELALFRRFEQAVDAVLAELGLGLA